MKEILLFQLVFNIAPLVPTFLIMFLVGKYIARNHNFDALSEEWLYSFLSIFTSGLIVMMVFDRNEFVMWLKGGLLILVADFLLIWLAWYVRYYSEKHGYSGDADEMKKSYWTAGTFLLIHQIAFAIYVFALAGHAHKAMFGN